MTETIYKSRIEALTDGVFAIAMTLLVLDLLIPGDSRDLGETLLGYLGKFESYFITFLVSGVYWMQHQLQFDIVKKASRTLIWTNIFFLMFVALIPATTMLLMRYNNETISVVIYAGNLFILGVILFLQWIYLCRNPEMIKALTVETIKFKKILLLINPCVFLIAIAISFFNPDVSTYSFYLIPLLFYIFRNKITQPSRFKMKTKKDEAEKR